MAEIEEAVGASMASPQVAAGVLEWLTASGTLLAAVVPVLFWLVERRERKAAQAELKSRMEADAQAEREAQARKVLVWKILGDVDDDREGVAMVNTSQLPVFDVCLYGYSLQTGRPALDETSFREVVLPGVQFASPSDTGGMSDEVWISFRDASGQEWARDRLGKLIPSPDREAMAVAPPRADTSTR